MKQITIIVPAHNEEAAISGTIFSLLNQTKKADEIIIVLDNCTDNTKQVVENMGVRYFETVNNKTKKAGALNQVLKHIESNYVLIMDADTILERHAVEAAYNALEKNSRLGAVCSKAGVRALFNPSKNTWWQRFLWRLQKIEYAMFDAHRIETTGKIKVAHGMATMYRFDALLDIQLFRRENQSSAYADKIYLEDSLTEDYELTLCLKRFWKVATCFKFIAWTEAPLSLKELWVQRLRWLRGGIDALSLHRYNKITKWDILNNYLFFIVLTLQVVVAIEFFKSGKYIFDILFWVIFLFGYLDSLFRLKYVENIEFKDVLLRLLYVPEIIYGLWQNLNLIVSFVNSFTKKQQDW